MDDRQRRLDALLELLTDEVARRLDARSTSEPAVPPTAPELPPPGAAERSPEPIEEPAGEPPFEPIPEPIEHPAVVPTHSASFMARLALGVFIIVAVINVPINAQGTALARSIPSSASLVIRNGLVVKEAASPEVWVYRDGAFHWISNLDAFAHFGYKWQDVHVVEPGYLKQFDKGTPLYVLLKCDASPHIYRLEAGQKRWIVDLATFTAQGHVWQDVEMVPCSALHRLSDGDSIPPERGAPPPPLP